MYAPDKIDTGAAFLLLIVCLANNGRGLIVVLCVVVWALQYATRHSKAAGAEWRRLGVPDSAVARFVLPGIIESEPLAVPPARRVLAQAAAEPTARISLPLDQISAPAAVLQAPAAYDATAAWLAAAQQQTPTHAALTLAQALAHLNDRPDDVPHFFVLGGTGAGKSTFARLVLAQRVQRGEQFLVLTGKRTMLFADLPCVGRDPLGPAGEIRYSACRAACRALLTEVARRDAVPIAHRQFVPLTIVFDDASILLSEANEAAEVVRVVGMLGRELAMRLMILTGSLLLKELNLEGRGDLRDHFAVVDYHKRLDGSRQTELRLRYSEKDVYPFAADQVPQLAPTMVIDPAHCWRPVVPLEPVPAQTGGGSAGSGTSSGTSSEVVLADTTALEPLIRRMAAQQMSRNQIAAIVGGNRQKALDLIRQILGDQP